MLLAAPCWRHWGSQVPTAAEARRALQLLTGRATITAQQLLSSTSGDPQARRLALLEDVPELISYYSDGSAALAADFYEDERLGAGVTGAFSAQLVIPDRTVKVRRAIAWAADPLFDDGDELAGARLGELVQLETARPFRATVTGNRTRDPQAVGWRRETAGGCRFCRMLAERGAVYRESTARFAAHANCHCTAVPVFGANDTGETASVLQYRASSRNRTSAQQAQLRDYLDSHYGADN